MLPRNCSGIVHGRHAFESLDATRPEGLMVISRRNLLKASMAGLAGLSLPLLLRQRATATVPR